MADLLEIQQAEGITIVGTLHDPGATVGDVLTVNADKSISAKPGSAPPAQAVYTGASVLIGDGGADSLTWDTLASGTELLDRSAPGNPVFLAAGVYGVTVNVTGDALTAAGFAVARITAPQSSHAYTQSPVQGWSVSLVVSVAAGASLIAQVLNHDGAAARNFHIDSAVVVKLA